MSNVTINVVDQVEQVVLKVNEYPVAPSSDLIVVEAQVAEAGTWTIEFPATDKSNIILILPVEAGQHIVNFGASISGVPVGARIVCLFRSTQNNPSFIFFRGANLFKTVFPFQNQTCVFNVSASSSGIRNLSTSEKKNARSLLSNLYNSTLAYVDIPNLSVRLNGFQKYRIRWTICFRTQSSSHSSKITLFPDPNADAESLFTARQETSINGGTHVTYYDKYDVNTNPTTSRFQSPSNQQNLCIIEAVAYKNTDFTITPRFRTTVNDNLVTVLAEKSFVEWERIE